MVTSIVQLVLSSVTIYRSRGSQLDQYGYAAFGLTVIPYTFMSLVNFIYVGVVGEYAALTILRTPTMEEANDRLGGQICGEVGILAPTNISHPGREDSEKGATDVDEIEELNVVDKHLANAKDETDDDEKTTVSLWTEENNGKSDILCVKIRDQIRKFRLVGDSDDDKPTLLFDVHPIASHLRVHDPETHYKDTILPDIKLNEVFKDRLQHAHGLHWLSLIIKWIVVGVAPLLAVILPPVLIAIWTGYHKGQSSPFQRVVMVSWLTFNQFAVLAAQFNLLDKYISLWKYKSALQSKVNHWSSRHESGEGAQTSDNNENGIIQGSTTTHSDDINACWAILILCGAVVFVPVALVVGLALVVLGIVVPLGIVLAVYGLPIAGFVEVGKMLKAFGTCTIDS